VQPPRVTPLRVGSVLTKPGSLPHRLGEIFREVADVPASFFGAAQDALDVHLRPKPNHVRGFGQLLTRLLPARQQRAGVGVGKGLGPSIPHRHPAVDIDGPVVGWPPHLVIRRGRDGP
jgi:hypothetical protein